MPLFTQVFNEQKNLFIQLFMPRSSYINAIPVASQTNTLPIYTVDILHSVSQRIRSQARTPVYHRSCQQYCLTLDQKSGL